MILSMTMYKCAHFRIEELVPQHVFEDRGQQAWMLLDSAALIALDALREKFGPITVNNWVWGGDRQWSGLRTAQSPFGSQYSQHRFGRAFDCLFRDTTAEEARQYILANPCEFPLITSMELGTSWLHFDTRNCDRIMTYTP